MTELFLKCIDVILVNEGGYQNNPNDLGNWTGPNRTGELKGTKYGIACRFFPYLDIKNLTVAQAREIYWQKYYLPMALEGIKNHLSVLQIFDFGVNAGKVRAIRTAQSLVNVKPDGLCGVVTRQAVNAFEFNFPAMYMSERVKYYNMIAERDPKNKVFLKGWLSRVWETNFNH